MHDRGTNHDRPQGGNPPHVLSTRLTTAHEAHLPAVRPPIGILAGLVSKKLFEALWGIFDEEEPPKPVTHSGHVAEDPRRRRLPGRRLQARARRVDRAGAKGFNF
jgi:hypothetical protein